MNLIPYGRQHIDQTDIRSVIKALKAEKITTGNSVLNFEKQIQKYLKCKYSISCNSGTSALYLALKAIDLKKNDKIIMPAITFVASYNVAKILGCKIYLADIDLSTGQMSPKQIIDCCKKNNLKSVKAIITMYNGGYPDNAENFIKIKKKYKSIIIEDACHALGSKYKIKNKLYKIGSCRHADISTFSLHPLKTITSGEGGIVTTNSKNIYQKICLLRSHGIKREKEKHWKYNVKEYSLNFRLSDIQCSLASSQLKKIEKFVKKRKKIAKIYDNFLSDNKHIEVLKHKKNYLSSFHLYQIRLKRNVNIKDKLIKFMLKNNVTLQYHYIPLYKFNVYKKKFKLKNSEQFYQTSISLPIFYELSFKQQKYILNKLEDFFKFIY